MQNKLEFDLSRKDTKQVLNKLLQGMYVLFHMSHETAKLFLHNDKMLPENPFIF